MSTEKQYLPAVAQIPQVLSNLRAARSDIGSGEGTGDTFLKVDDRSGALTFGQERIPLPAGHKFVVGLHAFSHGYIDMQGGRWSSGRSCRCISSRSGRCPPAVTGPMRAAGRAT